MQTVTKRLGHRWLPRHKAITRLVRCVSQSAAAAAATVVAMWRLRIADISHYEVKNGI